MSQLPIPNRFLAALALAAVVCASGAIATASQAPKTPMTYTVHLKNFSFDPASLSVPAGATVVFKNDDAAAHTVTLRGKDGFDSGNLEGGAEFRHVFAKPGRFDYVCIYHENMLGTIVVSDGTPTPAPSVTPPPPPEPSGY